MMMRAYSNRIYINGYAAIQNSKLLDYKGYSNEYFVNSKKKRKIEEKGTLRCNPVNSVTKKRRKQMKTAKRPAGQSAWQKKCL